MSFVSKLVLARPTPGVRAAIPMKPTISFQFTKVTFLTNEGEQTQRKPSTVKSFNFVTTAGMQAFKQSTRFQSSNSPTTKTIQTPDKQSAVDNSNEEINVVIQTSGKPSTLESSSSVTIGGDNSNGDTDIWGTIDNGEFLCSNN